MGVPILCLSRLRFWIHELCPSFLLPSFPLCLSSLSHSGNKHSDEHKVALQLWGWYDAVRQGKTWVNTEYEHVESEPMAGETQKMTSSFTKEMMVKRREFSRRLWRRQWHPTPVPLPGESQGGEPGRLQSMGSLGVRHDWVTSLSLFTVMHWRSNWQPTPAFLPGESHGERSLVGCRLWGRTESDTTEAT